MDLKGQLIQMPLQRKGYYILDWYQFYPTICWKPLFLKPQPVLSVVFHKQKLLHILKQNKTGFLFHLRR